MKQLESLQDAQRVERFQSLAAGQYWRAKNAIAGQCVDAREVLLIQSIRWVDDKPHTIILRPHPDKIGQEVELSRTDERGRQYRQWVRLNEHRFLLEEFLAAFEFEPDHERVRAGELKRVQGEIAKLQSELIEAQTDPSRMAVIVETGLLEARQETQQPRGKRKSKALPVVAAPNEKLAQIATGTVADALAGGITMQGIEDLKEAAELQHQIATVQSNWIQSKTNEIASTLQAMTPYFEERAAAALAHTEETRSYVAKLLQGIESLDLYVGKGVEVKTIRTGKSADREEPLTFMQKKLLMDEELAIWVDVDERFDFASEDKFLEALRTHDGLVRQIFPTPRCVLVMAVTRRHIDYGDPWVNEGRNRENHKVFLLVRDGENLHRVFSPVESHLGTSRLFPSKNDQDRVFRGFDGSQIKFDDVAYTDRLKDHELHALHYKRFLLLCCGLDHRLKLFGEFYPGPASMRFVSMEFQAQHCRFVHDDEDARLLGQSRPSVNKWIASKNAYLRSGSRVLCNWTELMNPSTAPAACFAASERRYGYETRYEPAERHSVGIVSREGTDLFVDIVVNGRTVRHERRTFNCKVNLSRFRDGEWDYTDQPFLCLDAVSPGDLYYYIYHRGSRRDHLEYIRFFKRAFAYVAAEHAEQAQARGALKQALEAGHIAQAAAAETLVDQAVVAWRAANRGRPLPDFDGSMSAEWQSLLDQMYLLAGKESDQIAEVEEFVRDLGYAPLRLVISGKAKLAVYVAPLVAERDDRLLPHAWVHLITLERGKRKLKEKSRRWRLLPRQAAAETTLHEWAGTEEWFIGHSPFRSPEHKRDLFALTANFVRRLDGWTGSGTGSMTAEVHARAFADWGQVRQKHLLKSSMVENPDLAVPIGLAYSANNKHLRFICVGTHLAHALMYRGAPSADRALAVKNQFVEAYARRNHPQWTKTFEDSLENVNPWVLLEISADSVRDSIGDFLPECGERHHASGREYDDPRLNVWLDGFIDNVKSYTRLWWPPGVLEGDRLDARLGTQVPADFEHLTISEVTLERNEDGDTLPKYATWFDIKPRTFREFVIARSERPQDVGDHDYTERSHSETSRAQARELIRERAGDRRAVPARELDDAPAAPDGVERWYVISQEEG